MPQYKHNSEAIELSASRDGAPAPFRLHQEEDPTAQVVHNWVHADEWFIVLGHVRHLGASLGVTGLTVALHYVFNCPDDKVSLNIKRPIMRGERSTSLYAARHAWLWSGCAASKSSFQLLSPVTCKH